MKLQRRHLLAAVILGVIVISLWWLFSSPYIELRVPFQPGGKWRSVSRTVLVDGHSGEKYYVVHYNGIFLGEKGWTSAAIFTQFDQWLTKEGWVKAVRSEENMSGIFYFETTPLPHVASARYERAGQKNFDSTHASLTVWYEDRSGGDRGRTYEVSIVTVKPSVMTAVAEGLD